MEGDPQGDAVYFDNDIEDTSPMDVRFFGTQDELAVFNDMVNAEETVETRFVDQVDKEWFTNNLFASISAGNSSKPNRPWDFGAGDEQ